VVIVRSRLFGFTALCSLAALAACGEPLRFDNRGAAGFPTAGVAGGETNPAPSARPRELPSATQALDSRRALEGGPVVLVFFIGEFCAYCRRQLTAFEQRIGEFRAAGATVWAVSSDAAPALNAMRRDLALSFPVGSDGSLEAISAFGVESRGTGTALPAVFVLAPDGAGGRVVFAQVGNALEDRASLDEVLSAVRGARQAR
jgi:peroxiredoxin